jgi:phosphopantothenoylcysteine decarboxylase/phosphopantothenate--cysteine ligase
MERRRVLLAVSGGIAAYKIPELVRQLKGAGHEVRCVLRTELFDPGEEGQIDHIALADWGEAVVVAPATANLLAKMAAGIADDLVTTLLLATRAPVLVAPAMNVNMWRHAATQANVATLRDRGIRFVGPESGELACGHEGVGRMAEPEAIEAAVELLLGRPSLVGERLLVTAGGTREPIDAVRAITNRSSGKMGFAVAAEAALRGADVILVAGPCALPTPPGVRRVDVETALERFRQSSAP